MGSLFSFLWNNYLPPRPPPLEGVGADLVGVLLVGVERVGVERGVLGVGEVRTGVDLVGVDLVGSDLVGVLRVGVLVGSEVVVDGVYVLVGSSSSFVAVDPQVTRVFFFVSGCLTGAASSLVTSPFGVLGNGVFGVSTPSVGFVVPGRTVPSPGEITPPGVRGEPIVPTGTIGGSGLPFTTGVLMGVTVSGVTTG